MLTTAASFNLVTQNLTRELDTTASNGLVSREKDYYLSKIRDIKSIDDFMGDQRIYSFAMKAFGLEDMTYAKAFMRKVLEGGVSASDSLANSLADPRYRDFAQTFNFVDYGSATTSFTKAQQGTVDKYLRQTLEENVGETNEGVRLALYFQRKAPDLTNEYSILADPALLKVALTALGLPETISVLPIEKQADMISSKISLDDLKDPDKLNKFLNRFTNMWDVKNAPTTSPMASLLSGTSSTISANLLASIQSLRVGGY
jgi:hypothetical protein